MKILAIIIVIISFFVLFTRHVQSKHTNFLQIEDCIADMNKEIGLDVKAQHEAFYKPCVDKLSKN